MEQTIYDAIVIGGGPAGLTAALYLARANNRVLVIEKETFGGQITITSDVVNYPGILKTSGKELTESMRQQAQDFGADFVLAEVQKIEDDGDFKQVKTTRGTFKCFGIVIATGAHPRKAGFIGEEEFKGHGIAYCATCDGSFFEGKEIFVVGGGYAAAEESVFLTRYAKHVTILIREDDFSCASSIASLAKNHEKITVYTNVEVLEVSGHTYLESLKYHNKKTNEVIEYHANENDTFGVFVFAGYQPNTSLVKDIVELNESGYIVTDQNQKTNKEGIYGAGDVCIKELRQVVTAVSDGAKAATSLEKYVEKMHQKMGIIPKIPQVKKEEQVTVNNDSLLDEHMLSQLQAVFSRMENPIILKLLLNESTLSNELKGYMEALALQTDKIKIAIEKTNQEIPSVNICLEDGTWSGLTFHGVPGGHEFTSFILGIYNVAGPGQKIEQTYLERIDKINKEINIKIIVSLSCTMCPELVTSAQRIASLNKQITTEVYDIQHFKQLKDQYQIMSVPCMVINDQKVVFGKKNIEQILEIIENV